jgi:hypothetical protein
MRGAAAAHASESLALRGRLAATVVRGSDRLAAADLAEYLELTMRQGLTGADALARITGEPDTAGEHREGGNVMCTTGYSALAAALVWSGLQDQASSLGLASATFLTPLYGAVGSGTGTPAKSDTALFAELGRQTVGAGASNPASSSIAAYCTWLFYFTSPATAWTVAEAGLFASASSTTNSGTMIDHWSFSPTLSVPTNDSLLLQISLLLGP